ncbi:uncharacterized protein [Oscarella lobularis]|uniref:uncharacterized protein n=1 Tax=Oscarella lobularis TaxID=121494 RepID=UPI003313800F
MPWETLRVCFLCLILLTAAYILIKTFAPEKRHNSPSPKPRWPRKGAAIAVNISQHRASFEHIRSMLFFVGYPRSCSTLLGTFLDAHPHIVLAHEYNFFNVWSHVTDLVQKSSPQYIYSQLLGNSILASSKGGVRSPTKGDADAGLFYHVPNQWNGRYNETIQVIGDKKAGSTSWFASSKLIWKLHNVVKVPIRFLHVIRNPYDNIATIAIRSLNQGREFLVNEKILDDEELLSRKINYYFHLVSKANQIRLRQNALDVHSIDLLLKPKMTLFRICNYLKIECSEKYLRDCASLLFKTPSQSRKNVKWTRTLIKEVEIKMRPYDFLRRYSFESD